MFKAKLDQNNAPTQLLNVTLNASQVDDHQVLKYQSLGSFAHTITYTWTS